MTSGIEQGLGVELLLLRFEEDVFQAFSTKRRHWKDYVSLLVCEHLGVAAYDLD